MKKTALISATVLVAVSLACWLLTRNNNILEHSASTLAASLANAKVYSDFGVRPFSASDGQIEINDGKWTWKATKGYGYTDLQAEISCMFAQNEPQVAVSQTINMQW